MTASGNQCHCITNMNFKCRKCERTLELEHMSASAKGLCKPCQTAAMKAWRTSNPDKSKAAYKRSWARRRLKPEVRERRKRYYAEKGEKRSPHFGEMIRKYKMAHREEHNARARAKYAVKTGVLVRPSACEFCKCECKPQAHHKDYSKPLEVIWICASCHRFAHSALPHPVKDWLSSGSRSASAA